MHDCFQDKRTKRRAGVTKKLNSEENEKIRKVELMAQIKMIETGVTKKDAYV